MKFLIKQKQCSQPVSDFLDNHKCCLCRKSQTCHVATLCPSLVPSVRAVQRGWQLIYE